MYSRWIQMELYRLQCVRQWPESPFRQATLSAILDSLRAAGGPPDASLTLQPDYPPCPQVVRSAAA